MTDVYEDDDVEVEYLNIHRFNLFGYIDAQVAADFIQALYDMDNEDTNAVWEVIINSEGGDMEAGTAIYSELASYSERNGGTHYVMTSVRGQAASCASLILQAGDHRSAGRMDYIMSHEPLLSFEDATMRRVKDELRQAESWTRNFCEILAERSELSVDFFSAQLAFGQDWWMSSQEALDYGLLDEVS